MILLRYGCQLVIMWRLSLDQFRQKQRQRGANLSLPVGQVPRAKPQMG